MQTYPRTVGWTEQPAGVAAVVAVALGLGWGAATSGLQTVLPAPFGGLANAVAPWVMTPVIVGTLCRSMRTAAALGLLTCVLQVVGYYVTSELRGFPAGRFYVVLWSVAAAVGGPVFGASGRMLRSGGDRLRGLPPAMIGGVWLAEGVGSYAIILRYPGEAVVFGVVGLVLFVLLTQGGRFRRAWAWLAAVVPVGTGAFLLL